MTDQFDIPLQEVATPRLTVGDFLAGFAASALRQKADKPKMAIARRAYLAAQSFPNNTGGYVRATPRDESYPPNTPERNVELLRAAYSLGPKPIIMPRKPSRREAIIKRRIAEKDLRKTVVADHPLGARQAADTSLGHKKVNVRGRRCRVAKDHLANNEHIDGMRSELARDLSVNAVKRMSPGDRTALDNFISRRASA